MILVTGASGFVGTHLLQLLAKKNEPVRALYYSNKPEKNIFPEHIKWCYCDLLDTYQILDLMEGVDKVYHCAAVVSFDPRKKKQILQTNITSTENLVNAALQHNIKKLIHVSSVAALGRESSLSNAYINISEDSYWQDGKHNSHYAMSKYKSEMEVWRGVAEGLDAAIVNPGIILGAGNWNEGSSALMKIVDKGFPWYTEGINSFVDVWDVARSMMLLMESNISNQRFIVSSGNYSYKEILTLMAKSLNKKPPLKKAGKFLSEIVWRLEYFKSIFTGKPVVISKESAKSVQLKCHYTNDKFANLFPTFSYTPIELTIANMAKAFKGN